MRPLSSHEWDGAVFCNKASSWKICGKYFQAGKYALHLDAHSRVGHQFNDDTIWWLLLNAMNTIEVCLIFSKFEMAKLPRKNHIRSSQSNLSSWILPVRSNCLRSSTRSRAPSATVEMSLSIRRRVERRGEWGTRDSETTYKEHFYSLTFDVVAY